MSTSIPSSNVSTRERTARIDHTDRTDARRATTERKDAPRTSTARSDAPAPAPRTMAQRDGARSTARAGEDLARMHLLRNATAGHVGGTA
ncbi:hypothetical protein L6R52_43445, partial [Myxococcota bacterium]|nr:hypothetical protein [Myxococcota bacterium]